MKSTVLGLFLAFALVIGSAGILWALPMTNTSNDGIEDYLSAVGPYSVGDRFAYYQNTGAFMFIGNYNNESNISQVQADAISWLNTYLPSYDTTGFTLVDTTAAVTTAGVDYNGLPTSFGASASGTYQVNTSVYPGGIEFYVVKAGNDFAMYFEEFGETYGSWSTFHLFVDKGTGSSLEISHLTGYNGAGVPIPEPATVLLIGTGLVGLVGFRKKFKK
jgi:hypothetical protein